MITWLSAGETHLIQHLERSFHLAVEESRRVFVYGALCLLIVNKGMKLIHWFFRQDKHTGPCVTGDTARHRDPTHPTPVVYKRLPHHTSEPSWQSISSGTSIEPDFQTSPKELSDIWNGNCRQRDIDNVVSQRIGYVSDFTTPLFLLQNCFKKSFNMKFSSVFVRMWSQFIFYLFCIKEVETV